MRSIEHWLARHRAVMAWQEGFPYARSIEHAKSAWAAHVDTWTELVAKGKKLERWRQWRRFHSEQPHYRMAWIVHEPFWQALRKTTANTMFAWWPELTREAALQGNTVALTHIPSYYTRAYFRRVQDASQSSHPRSVQWAIEHGILRDTFKHLNSWTLDSPLARSPWLNGYAGLDLTRRGSYEMAHWCLAAAAQRDFHTLQALHAAGHCMRVAQHQGWSAWSVPWQWLEQMVRPTYERFIDWDLLAALHGVPLPTAHPRATWSPSLLRIGEHAKNQGMLNRETLPGLCGDSTLEFLLALSSPRSIKDVYMALAASNESQTIEMLSLPPL